MADIIELKKTEKTNLTICHRFESLIKECQTNKNVCRKKNVCHKKTEFKRVHEM